jgi:hypothetical protein
MTSPDAASEIAWPIVPQAVAFVMQSLPSSPLTPSTYHVVANTGEDSMSRTIKTGTTLLFNMLTLPQQEFACDRRETLAFRSKLFAFAAQSKRTIASAFKAVNGI